MQDFRVLRRRLTRKIIDPSDIKFLGQTIQQSKTEKGWFDFSKNEVLCISDIIRSCFSNPERAKFPQIWKYRVQKSEDLQADPIIARVSSEMPSALKKFEDAEIQLYDVSTFYSEGPAKAKFIE